MSTSSAEVTHGIADGLALVLRELYIEIFAVLLPGFCFFILVVPAIGVSLSDFLSGVVVRNYSEQIFQLLEKHTEISFFGVLVMSYVAGQILFRCDPKYPDRASIRARGEEPDSCAGFKPRVDFKEQPSTEYPYGYLKNYLLARDFDHLADRINWDGSDFECSPVSERARYRSKHFINQLKLSIKLHHPRIYFEISRNETHIRLMSSIWHLATAIRWMATGGLLLGVASNLLAFARGGATNVAKEGVFAHGEAIVYPVWALLLAFAIKEVIQKFFHYQRVREIVYVLEAWHLLDPKRKSGRTRASAT